MNKIPTAEEFIESHDHLIASICEAGQSYEQRAHHIQTVLIEFAKLHVQAALKAASEIDFNNVGYEDEANDYEEARDMAIIASYPLDKII